MTMGRGYGTQLGVGGGAHSNRQRLWKSRWARGRAHDNRQRAGEDREFGGRRREVTMKSVSHSQRFRKQSKQNKTLT